MYAKIFSQIFDSTLADDYELRHIFMDLLVLADRHGVVDMTHEEIARRINAPVELIRVKLVKLCETDVRSRSKTYDGARLVPLDPSRDWGWQIVNFEAYHKIHDEDSKREYHKAYMAERRAKKKPCEGVVKSCEGAVKSCEGLLRHVYVDVDVDINKEEGEAPQASPTPPPVEEPKPKTQTPKPKPAPKTEPDIPENLNTPEFLEAWEAWKADRRERKKPMTQHAQELALKDLSTYLGPQRAIERISRAIQAGWQGLVFSEDRTGKPKQAYQPRQGQTDRFNDRTPVKPAPHPVAPPSRPKEAISDPDAWTRIRAELKNNVIGEEAWDFYFEDIGYLFHTPQPDAVLVLSLPSSTSKMVVSHNYKLAIEDAAEEVLGYPVSLEITLIEPEWDEDEADNA
jgi:hypothetical protein